MTTTYEASTGSFGQCASLSDCTNWQFVQSSPPPLGHAWGFATVTYNAFTPAWVVGTTAVTGSVTITLQDGMGHSSMFTSDFTGTWVVTGGFNEMTGVLSVEWPDDSAAEVPAGTLVHDFLAFRYRGGLNTRDRGGTLTVTTEGD